MDPDDQQIGNGESTSPVGTAGQRARRLRLVGGSAAPTPTTEQLDAWAVAVATAQDREAFSRLFDHYAPRMKRWLRKLGSPDDEAEEIVQDAFVVLWRKAAQFDPGRSNVAAWLFTIARNLRADRRRGLRDTWTSLDELDEIPDPAEGQEARAMVRQQRDRVREALAGLTDEQHALVLLSFYEDMSHSRIAVELDIPLGTVKTRLRRAATCLRQLLEGCAP